LNNDAQHWLEKIVSLDIQQPIRIMNVCGGHERTLNSAGLRSILPENIEIIPGPGCPVCVCPEEKLYFALQLAKMPNTIITSFGDMLRVPANNSKTEYKTLEQARSSGSEIYAVASPMDAIEYAINNKNKTMIFFAAGFETTMAPIAAMIDQGLPENMKLLLAGRKTWPIVYQLLNSSTHQLDALIAPGHVATIMGANEWQFVCNNFKLPCAIAGFTEESLLKAIYSTCQQKISSNIHLENCYPNTATNNGNIYAQQLFEKHFDITDADWRGIGKVKQSGFKLKIAHEEINAELVYASISDISGNYSGKMPAGCDCANVVLGQKTPTQCKLYGTTCTPSKPIGPCMVSDEGACSIWWSAGKRKQESAA